MQVYALLHNIFSLSFDTIPHPRPPAAPAWCMVFIARMLELSELEKAGLACSIGKNLFRYAQPRNV